MKHRPLVLATMLLAPMLSGATHLGVPVADLVQLECVADGGGACEDPGGPFSFKRRQLSGDVDAATFIVPAGRQLVVTDVYWRANSQPYDGFHGTRLLEFRLVSEAGAGVRKPVLASLGSDRLSLPSFRDGDEIAGGSEHVVGGISVGENLRVCAAAKGVSRTRTQTYSVEAAQVIGYLIDV